MKISFKKRYIIPAILVATLALGPKPSYPKIEGTIEALEIPIDHLDNYIAEKESKVNNLKQGNEAKIVWADSIRKTPYAIVYLHGFSASHEEGFPTHHRFAETFGCNLYLSRLAEHGIEDKDSFKELTPKDLVDSAKEAIAIGNLIGEKVIVMSCSTGGTLSSYLAALNPDKIDAQILYSPNIAIANSATALLVYPWGNQLLNAMNGGEYRNVGGDKKTHAFWTHTYRTEGVVALEHLLEETMTDEIFQQIKQPTFLGFYYKNEEEQDPVVSVPAMRDFFQKISTPEEKKLMVAFPDVGDHVITSNLKSNDIESVFVETKIFAEDVLGMKAIE